MGLPLSIAEILEPIGRDGYWFASDLSQQSAGEIVRSLGKILFTTDVTVKPGRALVTSDKALDYHTDHQRADLICWYCVEQTDQGGETILFDAYELLRRLPPNQVSHLKRVQLHEHKVFDRDPERFPFLSKRFGRDKIYYSYWMLKGEIDAEGKEAFDAFRRLTEEATAIRFRLQPRDILIIDNGRMLHGRTAIKGNKRRLLKRFWIAKANSTEGEKHATTGITRSYLAGANQPA